MSIRNSPHTAAPSPEGSAASASIASPCDALTGDNAPALEAGRSEPLGLDPTHKYHPLLAVGQIPCRSCPRDYPFPAEYMASAKRINDLPPLDWPVCRTHSEYAMVAGWFPLRTVEEWRTAIAKAIRS